MAILTDTSIDIEEAQLRLFRKQSPTQRVMSAVRLSSAIVRASKRAIASAKPELTSRQVEHRFVELHYGKELADAVRQYEGEPQDGRKQ